MLKALEPIRNVTFRSQTKTRQINIEGCCNWWHYRVTVILLLSCCAIVSCQEWLGKSNKIDCMLSAQETLIPRDVINSYCYITGGFTVKFEANQGIHPGVGPHVDEETKQHAYYLWVPLVLILQAASFYTPHLIAKNWQCKSVRSILDGLGDSFFVSNEDSDWRRSVVVKHMAKTLLRHDRWALKMLFVDFVYLSVAGINAYAIDLFVGGEFSTYGVDVVKFLMADSSQRSDPLSQVFPIVTKCNFRKYGPSGTIEKHDAMCVLPLNLINQRIYVLIWFWLVLLILATVIALLWKIAELSTSSFIKHRVKLSCDRQYDYKIERLSRHLSFGDWKLVGILEENLPPYVFKQVIADLIHEISDPELQSDFSTASMPPL